jgi:hypothetical protein
MMDLKAAAKRFEEDYIPIGSWGVQGGASSTLVEAPQAPDRNAVGESTMVISS